MKIARFWVVLCSLALFTSIENANANIGEAFGFGSRTAALAGAGTAWGFDAFSAYANPAALPLTAEKKLILGWSLLAVENNFLPISNVVVSNNYTEDGTTYGNVDTSYRSTIGQTLGFSYKMFPEFHQLSFGVVGFLPLNQVAYMDSGETYAPEYVLYRGRTQRPQLELGLGGNLGARWFAGVGMHVAFSLTTNAWVMLQSSATNPSNMRFSASMKPKVAPYFGLLYDSDADDQGLSASVDRLHRTGSFTAGAVLRFPAASANDITLNSGARLFGSWNARFDFNLTALSTLFYDPTSLEIGTAVKYSNRGTLIAQADYQLWNRFEYPAINLQGATTSSINVSGSQLPGYSLRNIVVPRIGHEYEISDIVTFRLGYAYKPSIFASLPADAGNYVDPPKHMINAGFGIKYRSFLGLPTPCTMDIHASYHQLVTQDIVKSSGNERGDAGLKIGAPGYQAGGKLYGGGVSVALPF